MVSADLETVAKQIRVAVLHTQYNCQQLPPGDTIVALRLGQALAVVQDYAFLAFLNLGEHRPDRTVAGVCIMMNGPSTEG